MARLRHVPAVLRAVGPIRFARHVLAQAKEDDIFTWAAALAYAWMFAIFPFLIVLLSLVPLLPADAKAEAYRDVERLVNSGLPQAADPIKEQVLDLLNHPRGGLLSIGLAITLWAAAGGMAMTMSAMDRCYDIRSHNARPYVKQRGIALMLTVIIATLVLALMVLMPIGTEVVRWLSHHGFIGGKRAGFINVARLCLSVILMIVVLGLMYHFGPSIRRPFLIITPGAVFSLAVWVVLAYVFRVYVDLFGGKSYNRTYGTVGGVVIVLLFFYLDAVVLLIGAEINSEIDFAVLEMPSAVGHLPGYRAMERDPRLRAVREQLIKKCAPLAAPTPPLNP